MQSNILSLVLALLVSIFLGPILPGPGPSKDRVNNPGASIPSTSPVTIPENPNKGSKMVLGYYVDGSGSRSSMASMEANSTEITDISGFWYTFDQNGTVLGRSNPAALERARSAGIGVYPLIHNIQQGYFNKKLAHDVFTDKNKRQRLVTGTAALAWRDGAKGVVIDIENLYPSDREIYQVFLSELKAAIGPSRSVIVAVPAKHRDDWTSAWSGAFDYEAVGRIVDYIALMSYDQHTLGSGPGPVASYDWMEKVVRYTLSKVPANKVLLGLAGYGYQWTNGKGKRALIHPEIVKISDDFKAPTNWSSQYQSPYLTYWDAQGQKNEVWFENHTSLGLKLNLVDQFNLKGVALWRLGQEDYRIWAKVKQRWSA